MGGKRGRGNPGAIPGPPRPADGGPRPGTGQGDAFDLDKGTAGHPRKRFYRARAHANPLNDGYYADLPDTPGEAPWASLYQEAFERAKKEGRPAPRVTAADVGCGFGGLLVRLAPHLPPGELAVGIELRDKVCDYVRGRAAALRAAKGGDGEGGGGDKGGGGGAAAAAAATTTAAAAPSTSTAFNRGESIAALRVNAQRHLPSLFATRSLKRLFFLFPDPHFKARAFRRRIVTPALVGEYSALVAPGGILYTATDVEELGAWMRRTLDAHPMYRRLSPTALLANDPAFSLLTEGTEEGQKVARAKGKVWVSCYVRLAGARCPGAVAADAAADEGAEKGGGEAGAGWEVVAAAVEAAGGK